MLPNSNTRPDFRISLLDGEWCYFC